VFFVLQIAWFARQIGSFRWHTFALYPIPLVFFFAIFFRSLKRRLLKQQSTWRARQL
jgi:4,4'-diaponeurosporenoate glycosyltransferase